MMNVCLVCVVHDATNRYVEYLFQASEVLGSVYPHKCIVVSDETAPETVSALKTAGWDIRVVHKSGVASARRYALRFAQQQGASYFHYCGLDRILTWATRHAEELVQIRKDIPNHDFVIFGRTERAFRTHPESWRRTETIANHICSLEFARTVGVTDGSCAISRESLDHIPEHSSSVVTDAEWPFIIHRLAQGDVGYRAVEGLEYVDELNGPASDQASSETWIGRLRISYLIGESAMMTGRT